MLRGSRNHHDVPCSIIGWVIKYGKGSELQKSKSGLLQKTVHFFGKEITHGMVFYGLTSQFVAQQLLEVKFDMAEVATCFQLSRRGSYPGFTLVSSGTESLLSALSQHSWSVPHVKYEQPTNVQVTPCRL